MINHQLLQPEVRWLIRDHHRHKVVIYRVHHRAMLSVPHVLYLHGTGNDGEFLVARLFSQLIARGMVVMSVDLEGHGRESSGVWTADSGGFMADLMSFLVTLNIRSVHLVGHSLGGAVALMSYVKDQLRYNSLSCLAVPVKVKLHQLYKEVALIGQRSYWSYVRSCGLWAALPAVGIWRRRAFPIRMAVQHIYAYPQVFTQWFHDNQVDELLMNLVSTGGGGAGVMWVEARWDGLASKLPVSLKDKLIAQKSYCMAGTTHLGVLIDHQVCSVVSEHILNHHVPS